MNKAVQSFGAAVAMVCTATPSLAQEQLGFARRAEQPPAAFAGVNVRLELGSTGRPTPVARLAFGRAPDTRGAGILSNQWRSAAPQLELGLTRDGNTQFYIGGQPARRVRERLNANGPGMSPAVIALSVALVAVGILVIANLDSLSDTEPAS